MSISVKGIIKLPPLNEMRKETMGLTYKHMNQILNGRTKRDFDSDNLKETLAPKKTTNIFDDILRLIIIDKLKLEENVKEILLSENDHQIQRILKCKWFFKNPSPEYYIENIFPELSVHFRCKVINILSKNVRMKEDAEKFFNYVQKNFGLEMAELFLPESSLDFIEEYYKYTNWREFNKSPQVFEKITQKHPKMALKIIHNVLSGEKSVIVLRKYVKSLIHLARMEPSDFSQIFKVHYEKLPFLKLRKFHKRPFGKYLKNWLLDNFFKCSSLDKKRFFRSLDFSDKVYVLKTFLENEENILENQYKFTNLILPYIKIITENKRHEGIQKVLEVYDINIWSTPEFWSSELLELLPLEMRNRYASLYFTFTKEKSSLEGSVKPFEPESIFYLYSFDFAFGKLKEELSRAPAVEKRRKILHYMVKNCVINRDSSNLPDLVSYLLTRHRNDDPDLIFEILDDIWYNFPLTALNSENYKQIEEFATLCLLRNSQYWNYVKIMEKCMHHRLEENLDVKEMIFRVIKMVFIGRNHRSNFMQDFASKHSKVLFLKYYEEFLSHLEGSFEDESRRHWAMELLSSLETLNKHHNKDPIRITTLTELYGYYSKMVKKIHGNIVGDDLEQIWETYSTGAMYHWRKSELFEHAFKKNPKFILNNLQDVLNDLLKNDYEKIFRSSRKIFDFLNVTEKIRELVLGIMESGGSAVQKKALELYSYLSTLEEFTKIIGKYTPEKSQINAETDTDFLEIQIRVPLMLRNVRPRRKNLSLILNFYTGDFIPNARVSLWSCCYWTKPSEAIPILLSFLKNKSQGRVSLKKDFIRIIAELSNLDEGIRFCEDMWKEENHYSIRTILLRYIFKIFLENPTEEFYNIFEKCLLTGDYLVVQSRPNLNDMPNKFLQNYVSALWNFPQQRDIIIEYFNKSNIDYLTDFFCRHVIENNLFQSKLRVDSFAAHYFFSRKDHKFIMEMWKRFETNLKEISKFLETLMRISWEYKFRLDGFEFILNFWPYRSVSILFEENLTLNFYVIYITEQGCNFWRKMQQTFTPKQSLIPIYADCLERFLSTVQSFDPLVNIYDQLLPLYKETHSQVWSILSILILPKEIIRYFNGDKSGVKNSSMTSINSIFKSLQRSVEGDDDLEIYFKRIFK